MRLPAGWIEAPIGSVVQFNPKHDQSLPRNLAISFVPMPAVSERSGTIESPQSRLLGDVWKGYTHFADGDVLFAKITPCMENGKAAIAGGLKNGIGCGSTEFVVMRPTSTILAEYLWLFIRQRSFRGEAEQVMTGAVGQRRVPLKFLEGYPIPLPPLPEQRRIVARIEALFARTRRARADLERIVPLARRHRDRTLATTFQVEWPEVRVADLAKSVFDGPFGSNLKSSDYTTSGTRVVRLENIGHLRFIKGKEAFISTEKGNSLVRHQLSPGDVLFSSFVDQEVRVCLFPDDLPTTTINKADCFCIRTDHDRCDPLFLTFRLASPSTYEDMREAVHGATRPRIGLSDLKNYKVGLPSLADQQAVASQIESAHGVTALVERESARALTQLDHLEKSILARAFRGELVPQDPADEPAGVLLARLNAERAAAPVPRRRRARA